MKFPPPTIWLKRRDSLTYEKNMLTFFSFFNTFSRRVKIFACYVFDLLHGSSTSASVFTLSMCALIVKPG